MEDDSEFEDFVRQNRDLIERMIALQKGAATDFVAAERTIADDAREQARELAEQARARRERAMRSAFETVTDPEVQAHFMRMGMEFFMGMAAIMQRAPVPDYVREGCDATGENWRRASEATGFEKQKVDITIDGDERRDEGDVFKGIS